VHVALDQKHLPRIICEDRCLAPKGRTSRSVCVSFHTDPHGGYDWKTREDVQGTINIEVTYTSVGTSPLVYQCVILYARHFVQKKTVFQVSYCRDLKVSLCRLMMKTTHRSKKSPTVGPTEQTLKPEYLIARSQLTYGSVGKVPCNS